MTLALLLAAPADDDLRGWVEQLGSSAWRERDEAMDRLLAAGEAAIPLLAECAAHADPEVRERAATLLRELRRPAASAVFDVAASLARGAEGVDWDDVMRVARDVLERVDQIVPEVRWTPPDLDALQRRAGRSEAAPRGSVAGAFVVVDGDLECMNLVDSVVIVTGAVRVGNDIRNTVVLAGGMVDVHDDVHGGIVVARGGIAIGDDARGGVLAGDVGAGSLSMCVLTGGGEPQVRVGTSRVRPVGDGQIESFFATLLGRSE